MNLCSTATDIKMMCKNANFPSVCFPKPSNNTLKDLVDTDRCQGWLTVCLLDLYVLTTVVAEERISIVMLAGAGDLIL